MRIAFLCKRRYMGKDVIDDRYGRLYEIPYQLARLGHTVRGYCLSYQGAPGGTWSHDASPGLLEWESRPLDMGTVLYPAHLRRRLRYFRPDVIVGASDIPHVALAARLGQQLDVPHALDLYDHFESFGQARIPGIKTLLRRAVGGAPLVTTTSQMLADHVLSEYRARGNVLSMPSTVDKTVFRPLDKTQCRQALGLPTNARLIGTAGGLLGNRGIGTLYDAWKQLAATDASSHLVLAGPTDPQCPPPNGERVHYLGMLAHGQIAQLFNALDVGVIYLRDSLFGRYCFPQKAYEMAACGIAIVATRVGAMTDVLHDHPQCLYQTDNIEDLTRCIRQQLQHPTPPALLIDDWSKIIGKMEPHLRALTTKGFATGARA
ncbi:glycosyl transferase group 1 [Nitrosococcus halophilus Nc 4]|uniref:Glycosyl transferase group 1 n=1 Tax=Nitrosococcus halophilus (strain Nc4) TaxID=472759 RepID=D5BWR5_NITHN|nr:glycosyltransferase family 4 protein [Nitrosococcus halophilus]ADE13796.1 glycosyl transferase group 1 [Nitrosococcus halophilus Nc 4]